MQYLSFIDLIIPPLYLVFFFFVANNIRSKNIELDPSYRFFIWGLFAKLIGAIAICLVYSFYYGGGDTTNYYLDGVCVSKLFLKNPHEGLRYSFNSFDTEMWCSFDTSTGWPIYTFDEKTTNVVRLTWILSLISFNSFIGQTMLLGFISYFFIFRLFKMFCYEFPALENKFAFSVLFVPSVIFWGSGLLKDSITFACVAGFTSSFHHLLKIRKKIFVNILIPVVSGFLLILIKPYIFFALLPGTILWLVGYRLSKLTNPLVKSSIAPMLIILSIFSGYLMLRIMGESLGEFSVDRVMDKAVVTQRDLKQDYYQGASFDIGEFEATVPGILSKAPAAINASLFRPYLWEAYNPGMIISAIENFILLLISIYLILKMRVYNLFLLLFRHHVLFFSVFFSLFFSFSVGLTTSNFGALVRYKIPAIPFYVASLFIIQYTFAILLKDKEARYLEQTKVKDRTVDTHPA